MRRRENLSLYHDERGAVAATYAIALLALIGVAGVAFDYTRMATLDSELQNAADQAALGAVTQLDGTATAIARATAQAGSLVRNTTVMSNDGNPSLITVASVIFYSTAANAETDTAGFTAPGQSANARFVRVTLATRRAFYALTPIVAAAASGNMGARATAGIGSALCKVPPIMMCNPNEGGDPEFTGNYVGKGLALVSVGGGGGSWAPGNFGYLHTNSGESNKILELKQALGWDVPPGDCQPQSGVNTATGANTPVTHAINTRFDIYENGGPGGGACANGGTCTPSVNSVKDVVRTNGASGNGSCGFGNNGWHLAGTNADRYLPDPVTRLPVTTPKVMGHPRDVCHAVSSSGDCSPNAKIGDGNWDRATYFTVNYPGINWQGAMTTAYGTTNVTRFQVYKWEITNKNTVVPAMAATVGANRIAYTTGGGGNPTQHLDHMAPVCSGNAGIDPASGIDRRTFPIAVVNCTAGSVNGNSQNVPVKKWLNVFLVEPSLNRDRTGQQDVYVEVVSIQTPANNDGGASAVVRRDKPYLIK